MRIKEFCRLYKLAKKRKPTLFPCFPIIRKKSASSCGFLIKIFCFPPICSLPCVKPNGNRSILHDSKISTYTISSSFSPTKLQFCRGPRKNADENRSTKSALFFESLPACQKPPQEIFDTLKKDALQRILFLFIM